MNQENMKSILDRLCVEKVSKIIRNENQVVLQLNDGSLIMTSFEILLGTKYHLEQKGQMRQDHLCIKHNLMIINNFMRVSK